jgi:hypothetical protein
MRKIYFAVALMLGLNASIAQTVSSGAVALGSLMTLKIDKDITNSVVTVTLTGPTGKWFGIGFNANNAMTNGTDCLYYDTSLVDSKITGYFAPTTDATNEWTVSSNTTSGTTRTLVLTRNFVGGTGDYTFSTESSLAVIWAYGSSTTMGSHSDRGSKVLTFNTLSIEGFTTLEKISIAPNPSNGVFTISKNSQISISKITIYDINAKELKVIDSNFNYENCTFDLSKFAKGVYFVEIVNETDKVVKKIVLE